MLVFWFYILDFFKNENGEIVFKEYNFVLPKVVKKWMCARFYKSGFILYVATECFVMKMMFFHCIEKVEAAFTWFSARLGGR